EPAADGGWGCREERAGGRKYVFRICVAVRNGHNVAENFLLSTSSGTPQTACQTRIFKRGLMETMCQGSQCKEKSTWQESVLGPVATKMTQTAGGSCQDTALAVSERVPHPRL